MTIIDASQLPPMPIGADSERMTHTRLRRRILYGKWKEDLESRITSQIGSVRREVWGEPDLGANVLRAISAGNATLYDQPVTVRNHLVDTEEGEKRFALMLEEASLWPLMQRVQRDTVGMREMLVRMEISDKGRLRYRPAFPDLVQLEPHPDDPMDFVVYRELRQRRVDGRMGWFWDVFELHDDGSASHRVYANDVGKPDTRQEVTKKLGIVDYRYKYADGEPFIPATLYHAATTGQLWDAWEWREIVEITLNVGMLWSFWLHTVKDASWPQRYAANVILQGTRRDGHTEATARGAITTDPSTVLMLSIDPDGGNQSPQLGQWQPGGNPKELAESIAHYERRAAVYAGMAPSDITRQSGDPRSGYALAINKSSQREAQQRSTPTFSRSDRDLLRKSAALSNRWSEGNNGPPALPELGWRGHYTTIPLTPEERRALIDEVKELLGLRFIDRVEALRRLEGGGMTRAEAKRALRKVEKALAAEAPPAPPTPPSPPKPSEGEGDEEDDPDDQEGGDDG